MWSLNQSLEYGADCNLARFCSLQSAVCMKVVKEVSRIIDPQADCLHQVSTKEWERMSDKQEAEALEAKESKGETRSGQKFCRAFRGRRKSAGNVVIWRVEGERAAERNEEMNAIG